MDADASESASLAGDTLENVKNEFGFRGYPITALGTIWLTTITAGPLPIKF